jgi:flagellar basal-body rod protein FlgG
MRALHTAATGMLAQERNVEVIANNVANMRTTGYKRQRAEFQDLYYENLRRVGSATSDQSTIPAGVQLGSGVKLVATPRVFTQGNFARTDREYDVAARGEGFFQVQLPDGRTAYTRDGSFELSSDGTIVTQDGYTVDAGIVVPNNTVSLTIANTGLVEATVQGQAAPQQIGQLQLARFINKSGLESMGDNLFLETAASGQAIVGNPGSEGFGSIQQGYVEEGNVNAVTEIADLIAAQRAYEMNSKIISAADEMLSAAGRVS